jgi:hypothetical protein
MVNYKYNCDNCSLHTNSKQSYDRHLLSKRHKEIHESNTFIYPCNTCKKLFKARVGRWHHSRKCIKPPEPEPQPEINIADLTQKVDNITNMLVDIKENQQPTTAITNNQQNNQNYNVNLFLNEHCNNGKNFIE